MTFSSHQLSIDFGFKYSKIDIEAHKFEIHLVFSFIVIAVGVDYFYVFNAFLLLIVLNCDFYDLYVKRVLKYCFSTLRSEIVLFRVIF